MSHHQATPLGLSYLLASWQRLDDLGLQDSDRAVVFQGDQVLVAELKALDVRIC